MRLATRERGTAIGWKGALADCSSAGTGRLDMPAFTLSAKRCSEDSTISELRQSTNVSEHRVDVFYQADKSVQLGFTGLVGRPLASRENWLRRFQLDTIYIF
jgi:hypothetical protein